MLSGLKLTLSRTGRLRLISELDEDWRRLDERLQALSAEIQSLSDNDVAGQRLMTVPVSARSSQAR